MKLYSPPWLLIYNPEHFFLNFFLLKFIYSEKATKFCKKLTVDLSYVVMGKSTMKISQKCCGLLRMVYKLYSSSWFPCVELYTVIYAIFVKNEVRALWQCQSWTILVPFWHSEIWINTLFLTILTLFIECLVAFFRPRTSCDRRFTQQKRYFRMICQIKWEEFT